MLHRPGMFAGGVDRAEAWFRSAVSFFEAQSVDLPWPDWGRAGAFVWLRRTLPRRGHTAGAKEQDRKALDIEADFARVRDELLAALEAPRQ